jgi:hypothetical protein
MWPICRGATRFAADSCMVQQTRSTKRTALAATVTGRFAAQR